MADNFNSIGLMSWTAKIVGALLFLNLTAYAQTEAVVSRNHPAMAETMAPVGGLAAQRTLSMSVTLALRNRDQLQQLLADQQNPSSPEYHHFLTSAEFTARFGPIDYDGVREWLTSEGFQVTHIDTSTRVIQFSGTVAQAQQSFSVGIQDFGHGNFGNATDPTIPARFSGVIGHIRGLDNMWASRPGVLPSEVKMVAPAQEASAEASIDSAPGDSAPGFRIPGITPVFFGPSDFYTFYDETPLLRSGLKGTGCIGIIGDSKALPSAVAFFDKKFKVGSSHLTTVLVDRGSPGFNNDEVEAELDLEWSHAVAPGAATRFYIGNPASSDDPLGDAIGRAVSENRCSVISISFGFCGAPDSFYTGTLDPLFMQAAAQGQSIITITHDDGAAYLVYDPTKQQCVQGSSRAVSEMAADPNVTAVGGTQFVPTYDTNGNDTGFTTEDVWNDSSGASGGGESAIFSKPSFQTGLGVPDDGMRDVPDVSLFASLLSPGAWAIIDTSCFPPSANCTGKGGLSYAQIGGTSLSAPSFAGIVNIIGQAVGKSLGNVDPIIYDFANKDLAGSGFHDVTSGNNDFNGVTGYTAGPDYDLCTGWGSVDAALFATAYAETLPGPTVTLSPMALNFKNVRTGTTKSMSVTIGVPKGQTAWTLIDSVVAPNGFAAAQTCVGEWIGPGKKCKFPVTFSPSSAGTVGPLTLTVTDLAQNSPQTIMVSGTGK